MTLVEKIKKLADEHHTTFAEIERKINISNGQIRRWDNSSPKVENIQKVADYFNVSVDYLLGRETSNNEEASMAKQVMMRMDTDGLSEKELDEIQSEMERFFSWRIEEIKRERGE